METLSENCYDQTINSSRTWRKLVAMWQEQLKEEEST